MEITCSQPLIKVCDNESNIPNRHWRCHTPDIYYIEIMIHHMTILLYLQINAQVGRAIFRPGHHLLDALGVVMLMVGPNQNFQQRHHTPVEGMPGAKLNCQKLFEEIIDYEPIHRCTKIGRAILGLECSLCGFQYPLKN